MHSDNQPSVPTPQHATPCRMMQLCSFFVFMCACHYPHTRTGMVIMAFLIAILHSHAFLIGQKIGMMCRIMATSAIYQKVSVWVEVRDFAILRQCSPQDFLIGYGATHIASFLCREHITPTPAFSTPPGSMPVFLCSDAAGHLASWCL